jgi:glycosyltransferase involved in cell wall biosynthesis
MKKGLVLTGFDPFTTTGGIETYTRELSGLLDCRGIQTDFAAAENFENLFGLKNRFIGQVYTAGRSLLDLSSDDYELVIANGYYGGGYFPKQLRTITIFHSTHAGYAEAVKAFVPASYYLEIRHLIGDMLERTSAFGAKIVAVSDSVKSELRDYYGIEDTVVIENPVDTEFFRRLPDTEGLRIKYEIPSGSRVGLYVGRWETSKGVDVIDRLITEIKDVIWVIVAASGGETAPPGSASNVRSFSGLDKTQMREIYSIADFMIFPSRYEGFGLAASEAMSCGVPVIGSPVGFLKSVFSRPLFSMFSIPISLSDISEIVVRAANSIRGLLSDDHMHKEISREGRQMIRDCYDVASWRKKMDKILWQI